MKKTIQGKTLPHTLFLVQEEDGKTQWYNADPFGDTEKESHKTSLEREMLNFLGPCDEGNPIVVKIVAAVVERCTNFDVNLPGRIRCGEMRKHFEDFEGNLVEILSMRNNDLSFPFNGAVMDRAGNVREMRRYSVKGLSDDGNANHRIVALDGLLEDMTEKVPEQKQETTGKTNEEDKA